MSKRIEKARQERKECCFTTKRADKNSVTSELCSYSGNSKIVVFTINYSDEKYLEKQRKVMMNYSIIEAN